MKTQEEIDELYHKLYTISIDGEDNLHYYSFVDGYKQCQEDMTDNFLSLIEEYREKELPNKDVPYHYEAEIDSGLKYLIMFIKNKQE